MKLHERDGGDNIRHAPESGDPTETGKHSMEKAASQRKSGTSDRDLESGRHGAK